MSKTKYLVVGIIVFLLLLWVVFIIVKTSHEQENPVDSSLLNATTSPIVVSTLNPDVSLKATSDFVFKKIGDSATTTSGTSLKTDAQGRALIDTGSAHKTLVDYNSQIVLANSSGIDGTNQTSIALITGAIWSRLEKIFDKGEFYEIRTDNAVAIVRGTSFGMWFNQGTTTLIVTEGQVAFASLDDAGHSIPNSEVLVVAGQKATRGGKGNIIVTFISTQDKKLPWFIYNNQTSNKPVSPSPKIITPVSPKPVTPTPIPAATSTATSTPAPAKIPMSIKLVTPSSAMQYSTSSITIYGEGFVHVNQVLLGANVVSGFNVVDSGTIQFLLPAVNPDTYSVSVVDTDGTKVTKSASFTVTPLPPPPRQSTTNSNLR